MENSLETTKEGVQLPASSDDEDETYYQDIIRYSQEGKFPDLATEVYRKQIQKRSAKHFMHEGTLYFKKRRQNLKVILGKEERTQLLQSLHINPKTGAHLGLRKVHDALVQNYHWRTCYTDASLMVKQCEECSETTPLNLPKNEDLCLELETAANSSSAWQRLELRIHGAYPPTGAHHTHVISILDPSSGWVSAAAVHSENLAAQIARFLFQTCCDFGPAPCFVYSDAYLFEQVHANLAGKMLGSLSFHQLLRQASDSSAPGGLATKWITKLEELISSRPNDWDDQLAEFLWQLRTTPHDNMQLSAFVIMFGREPNHNSSGVAQSSDHVSTATSGEAAPEEITAQETSTAMDSVPPTRRRLRSAIWQCRHCSQVFTSKISFHIHQRMHTEEAKRRGAVDGEAPLRVFAENQRITRKPFLRKRSRLSRWAELARARARHTLTNAAATADSSRPEATTDDTVAAVKALLALTKEERSKRGKYRRYTPELRDEIARYAISRGVCDTTRVFSSRLGFNVSESSVRNFVKAYTNFTPELKEEIGKSAVHSGMEATRQLYASRLGRELRPAVIRKFKRLYLRKHPELHPPDSSSSPLSSQRQTNGSLRANANKSSSAVIRTKRVFCPSMKDEIGRFAAEHGVAATLQHYTDKLQFPVKESTVRKFRKKYLDALQAVAPRSPEPGPDKDTTEEVFFPPPGVSGCLEPEMEVMHQPSSSLTLLHPGPHPPYSHHPPPAPFHPLPPPPPFPPQLCPSREAPHYGPLQPHSQIDHHTLESSPVAVPSAAYDCPPLYSHASNYPVPLTNQTQQQHPLMDYSEPSPLAFHHHQGHSFIAAQPRQRTPLPVAIAAQQPSLSHPHAYNPVYHVANAAGAVSHVNLGQQPPSHLLLPPPPTFQQHLSMANSHHHHASAHSLSLQPAMLRLPLSLERKNVTATEVENGEEAAILPGSAATVVGEVPLYPQPHLLRKSDADKNLMTVPVGRTSFSHSQPHVALVSAPAYNHQELEPNKGTHQHRDLLAEAAAVATAPDLQQQQQPPPLPGLAVAVLTSSISAGDTEPAVALGRPLRYRRTDTRNAAHAEQDNADRDGYYHTEDEEEDEVDESDSYEADERVTRRRKSARGPSQPRRGNYASYSPELRAEIGKYAIEQGNQKAMVYFKDKLGLDIPESTIRGLRDKYVVKRVQRGEKEVTSLGFAQRGRPMRLGKYDGVVQDCIRQLIKSGEKISSFLCIATAKQVLMQHEPALLEENGGPIKLNPTWAKSFLKRMGANNLA